MAHALAVQYISSNESGAEILSSRRANLYVTNDDLASCGKSENENASC